MKFPFITRSHHEEVVALLVADRDRIEQERRVYLDRLAAAGLGGTFFAQPEPVAAPIEEAAAEPTEMTPEDHIRAFRRRPSHLSHYVTRQFRRKLEDDTASVARGAHIRRDVDQDLDAAEEAGRRQANK